MTSLYEVWQATEPLGHSWGVCWEGHNKVLLPLTWARAYAKELSQLSGVPTQVRGKKHKIKVTYGLETA